MRGGRPVGWGGGGGGGGGVGGSDSAAFKIIYSLLMNCD